MLRTRRWLILLAVLILALLLIAPSQTGSLKAQTVDVMRTDQVDGVLPGVGLTMKVEWDPGWSDAGEGC